jgi:hypothetical protein
LPDSDVFGGTVNVTPYPVRLGTIYLDAGPVETSWKTRHTTQGRSMAGRPAANEDAG